MYSIITWLLKDDTIDSYSKNDRNDKRIKKKVIVL